MAAEMIYLDAAATTAVRRDALEAAWPYLTGNFGNPSSHHTIGEAAARALADARARVARWLGCRAGDIVFTSGGTEADNLAVKGIALANPRGRHIVTTRIEHEAVLESVEYLQRHHGFDVTFAETDRAGLVRAHALSAAMRDDTTLVSIAYANNEVGTVQPIAQLAEVAHERGAVFHTDAVQAAGWLNCSPSVLGVDAMSISGHKLGAPKGIGVLFVRGRIRLEPVLHGGGQERGRRSGTENVAWAVALATAVELTEADREANAAAAIDVRDRFIASVRAHVPGAELTGDDVHRLPATASFVFPGTNGEAVLLELERRGVVSSSGSACAAGSEDASHVLLGLGYAEDIARTAVRFSWSADVDASRLMHVASEVRDAVGAVRALASV
jgi:cysteine desulfurase